MTSIALYKPHKGHFRANIIAWWRKSPYYHAALIHDFDGYTLVSESTSSHGISPLQFNKSSVPDYIKSVPWIPEDAANEWITNHWGIKYGFLDLSPLVIPNIKKDFVGMHCGEFVGNFLYWGFDNFECPLTWTPLRNKIRALNYLNECDPKFLYNNLSIISDK